jgi:hypothetical protein
MLNDDAERIRLKYKYRRLILTGKLLLPHEDAARLLGPDCAYHLYSYAGNGSTRKNHKRRSGKRPPRRTGRESKRRPKKRTP